MKRSENEGRVSRHVSNNVTRNVFGGISYKLKRCNCCGETKPYGDFYVKANRQDVHRNQIVSKDLRSYCIPCYDEANKNYNKGSNPKPVVGNTIETFFEEVE